MWGELQVVLKTRAERIQELPQEVVREQWAVLPQGLRPPRKILSILVRMEIALFANPFKFCIL